MERKYVVYGSKKLVEGVGLGMLFYLPFASSLNMNELMWSIACSVITSFGIDYLCEREI